MAVISQRAVRPAPRSLFRRCPEGHRERTASDTLPDGQIDSDAGGRGLGAEHHKHTSAGR